MSNNKPSARARTKRTAVGGLGKDFSALIPDDMLSEALAVGARTDAVTEVALNKLTADPTQPRKNFDQPALEELAASIKVHGVVQPLIVSQSGSGYIIIAGERRFRAAQLVGLERLPVIIRSFGEQEKLEIALIENIQREDLTTLDLAAGYLKLHDQFNLSYEQVAAKVGKSVSAVHNVTRLLRLPLAAKQALNQAVISEGHARQIIALKEEAEQLVLLQLIIKNGWTVRQAEQYVVGKKRDGSSVAVLSDSPQALRRTRSQTPETDKLAALFKTPVAIKHTAKGGQLLISFSSDQQLKQLIDDLLAES